MAILHETFVGYYHNGFLVASQTLTKYAQPVTQQLATFKDAKGQNIPLVGLVRTAFDSLVLSTLELVLDDEKAVVSCLSLYFSGVSLGEALAKIGQGRSDILQTLHMLYQ